MLYAVITGDVVESSRTKGADKEKLINTLKEALNSTEDGPSAGKKNSLPKFNIFRGDSFQGVLSDFEEALKAAVFIRSVMRKNQPSGQEPNWDVRLAIGIGSIENLPENISEGDGPAYRNSGPALDELQGDYKLAIKTPWPSLNEEFKASCALLDAVIAKWTPPQAEIVWGLLQEKKAKTIARELDISQAAVHYRVKGSGWFAIEAALQRYRQAIKNKL